MVRRLVTVFSLKFFLSAGLSAFGLSMDPRSVNAGDTHLLFDLDGQDLADELVQADADPDSPNDNLLNAEWSDWPDLSDRLSPFPSLSQGLVLQRFLLAAPSLPWPFLAALQRPPSFTA